jgi:RNA polymerase sigma factor (sigma-70 family)
MVTPSSEDDGFAMFCREEHRGAVRLAHLLTGSNDAADDIAQIAMSRLYDRFDELDRPVAYLRTTIVNLCRNWHRSEYRRRRAISRTHPPAPEPDPQLYLLDLIDGLPYRQKAVVVMRYWLDLPEREIAAHLGCRPGTVKSLASRAMERLRKDLE